MKEKHPHLLPGTSNQTNSLVISQNTPAFSHDEEEAMDDQLLYDELDKLEIELKNDSESTEKQIETINRLRAVIKKKGDLHKALKRKFDDEMSLRSEVEENLKNDLKDLDKIKQEVKVQRERNLAIMRESKKKKSTNKDLENKEVEHEKEITILRVKNAILEKDNAQLKTVVEQKAIYIKQLEDATAPDIQDESEVIVEEPEQILMNRDNHEHKCNACDKGFSTSHDLDNHMEAKHNQQVCVFCEKVCANEQHLRKHVKHCLEYGNTTVNCDNCDKTFTRFGIKRHGDSCKGSTEVWACPECGFRARTSNDIKKHQNEKHNKVEVSREVCKHWRNGNCFRGDRCGFSHVGTQRKQTPPSTTRPTTSIAKTAACRHGDSCSWLERGVCSYFHKGVGVQKPSSHTAHGKNTYGQSSQTGKLCHHNEKCNRRATCPYKHTSKSSEGFHSQRRQQQPPMRLQKHGRFSQ